jgi:hypothetical protein
MSLINSMLRNTQHKWFTRIHLNLGFIIGLEGSNLFRCKPFLEWKNKNKGLHLKGYHMKLRWIYVDCSVTPKFRIEFNYIFSFDNMGWSYTYLLKIYVHFIGIHYIHILFYFLYLWVFYFPYSIHILVTFILFAFYYLIFLVLCF